MAPSPRANSHSTTTANHDGLTIRCPPPARDQTDLPLAVGFGITSAETVKEVAGVADAVVVGSAILNAVDKVSAHDDHDHDDHDFHHHHHHHYH